VNARTAAGRAPQELEEVVASLVERVERRFFGKYRGRVIDNEDPLRLGRLKVSVPSVFGPEVVTGWASPCAPYGGAAGQGLLLVPDRKAGVWVEFEEGDPEFPIWSGTFWTKPAAGSQLPAPNAADGKEADGPQAVPTRKTFKTRKGHTWQFEDADGAESVLLREGHKGHRIVLDAAGITITDADDNVVVLGDKSIKLTDATGNAIELTPAALTITAKKPLTIDASGQPIQIIGKSIDLKKG
jgi:uncharacterized protein involved in type VI secretion and phage assembly